MRQTSYFLFLLKKLLKQRRMVPKVGRNRMFSSARPGEEGAGNGMKRKATRAVREWRNK